MDVSLLAAPPGFNVACTSLGSACSGAAKAVVASLAKDVFAQENKESTGINSQALQQEFAAAECACSVEQVQQWASAIAFIHAAAQQHQIGAEDLFAQLQENTELGSSASKMVARQYALQQQESAAPVEGDEPPSSAKVMTTGRLVDTNWSVGVTVAHSLRANNSVGAPQTPLVALDFGICTAGGDVQRSPVTMTVSEFRELHKQLRDAARAMDGM